MIANDMNPDKAVVFYDGVCGICNFFVRFLIANDTADLFRFASLQSDYAHRSLDQNVFSIDSMVLVVGSNSYVASEAVLRSVALLGGGWSLLSVLLWIPRRLRDVLYRIFAHNRYLLGSANSCLVPSDGVRKKFIL